MTRPKLRSARLILRDWRDSDLDAFAALSADPDVMELLMGPRSRANSDEIAARWRAHFDEHGFGFWVVELPGEADFIGVTGLGHIPYTAHFTPSVEIGWRLARRYWGRGYATEAAAAALDHGFGPLGLTEITANTMPMNHRSRAVMERLGMTRDPSDDYDHPRLPADHPGRRHVLYRLQRAAWQVRQ
jgi:ribosomal-protein-alanine N-acetyltransferase